MALRVGVQGEKLFQCVPRRHFCRRPIGENANVRFLRHTIRRALVACYVLLFVDFVNFGQSRLSGLSLGAFINSTR